MRTTSSELMPQLLFGITLLASLLGFGVMFDRLADAFPAQPTEIELRLFPTVEPARTERPR